MAKECKYHSRFSIGILFILILTAVNINTINAQNDFKTSYDSIYESLNRKNFTGIKPTITSDDTKGIHMLYEKVDKSDRIWTARIKYLDAFVCSNLTIPDYDKALRLLKEAQQVLTAKNFPTDYARIKLLEGTVYFLHNSQYVEAFQALDEALEFFRKQKDMAYCAKTYNQLGLLAKSLEEYDLAIKYWEKSKEYYEKTGLDNKIAHVMNNICTVYAMKGNWKETKNIINEYMKIGQEKNDTLLMMLLYNNLAITEYCLNHMDSTLYYFDISLKYSSKQEFYKPYIYSNIGEMNYLSGNISEAKQNIIKALHFADKYNNNDAKIKSYKILSEIESQNKNYKDAYFLLKKYEAMNDSISLVEKIKDVQELRYKKEQEIQRQKAEILKKQKEIHNATLLIILLLLMICLTILIFILFYINNKRKIKEMENERLIQQLHEKEVTNKLKQLEQENEIKEKEREITTANLLMENKKKMQEQLLKTFKPYYDSKELAPEMWNILNNFISESHRQEYEWEHFKVHFEKVHPDFFKALKAINQHLSENDLRFCAYIRIGMTSKQLAEMLSIDYRSVLTTRYRIKKKLGIEKDMSIDDFIRDIKVQYE